VTLVRHVSAVLALTASAPALGAITVHAEVEVGASWPVVVVREFAADRDGDTPAATVFFDEAGARCEVLLNADAVGVQTFVAVNVQCRDARGRVVLASQPNVLMTNGEPAEVTFGQLVDAETTMETRVGVRLTVSEQPDVPPPVSVRREVFAKAGDATYAFYRLRSPWTGLSCEPGAVSVDDRQGDLHIHTQGRFKAGDVAEARCTADSNGQRVDVPVVIAFL
jgi:hypothetical protein